MIHEVISLCKERDVTLTTYIHDQSEQGKYLGAPVHQLDESVVSYLGSLGGF